MSDLITSPAQLTCRTLIICTDSYADTCVNTCGLCARFTAAVKAALSIARTTTHFRYILPAGQTPSDGSDDFDQLCAMLCGDSPREGDQQQAGHDPGVQSRAPPFPLSQPPCPLPTGPAPATHLSALSRSAALPNPVSLGSWFDIDTPSMQQPDTGASPRLPTLIMPSSARCCQQAVPATPALAGESPDSVQSATVACGSFSRQAVSADWQPQGHHLQGHYQQPCQEQGLQYRWQQGQGQYPAGLYQEPCQEQLQWQQGQGQYPEEPYQEPFQAQLSQEQLWRQSMPHQPLQPSSLWGGSYTLEQPQDIRGKAHMPAAAEVAAPFPNPLDPWPSNASSASHASLPRDASGGFTPQTQPRMLGQRLGQGLGTAPSAALLSTVGGLVPLASGSGQKRKAHEDQVNLDALDDLDEAAVAKILADPFAAPSASDAYWTDIAAISSVAACAYGQHLQLGHVAHMAQMQATAQQWLPAAAAAAETQQPEKKRKTGHSSASSRSVYRAPVLPAAHGHVQGSTAAGPSPLTSHGSSSMASPPPGPLQAPAAARPSRRIHVHAARLRQSPLRGTGARVQPTPRVQQTPMVQPTSRVNPQASGGPSAQPWSSTNSLGYPTMPAHSQAQPQAQSKPQRRHKDQAGPQAQSKSRLGAPPSNSVATQRGAPAATRRGAPTATRRTAQAAARTAAPAAPPAAAPAAAPAVAPAQGSRYQVGQMVWARCGKSPWWPATVSYPLRLPNACA